MEVEEEGGGRGEGGGGVSGKREEGENALSLAEIVAEICGSCSFTTLNEDDSSSTPRILGPIMGDLSILLPIGRRVSFWVVVPLGLSIKEENKMG